MLLAFYCRLILPRAILSGLAFLLAGHAMAAGGGGNATLPTLEQLLETPVSGAAKRPQRPADAPSMTGSISAAEIRAFGWQTLGQALSALRGIHTSQDRSYTYLGIRGFGRPGDYNNRVLLLIDGTPINDGLYNQAMIGGEFPLDLALIDRIEYVPGPGSVLHGGNAFFGVINIVTAPGSLRGREIEVGAGAGRAWNARATAGARDAEGNDWLVSASRGRRRGDDLYFEAYAAPGANAWSHGLDHESIDSLYGRFSRGGLLLEGVFGNRVKGYPGGGYGVDLDDPRSRQGDRTAWLGGSWEHRLGVDWQLGARAFLGDYAYRAQYSTAGVLEREEATSRFWGGEVNLLGTTWQGHATILGLAWRDDYLRQQATPTWKADRPSATWGLYLQDDWTANDALGISAGVRLDRDSRGHAHLSPRFALIVRPRAATQIKLITGRAFRDPNGYESDYSYAGANIPNPALQSERIRGDEIGIEHGIGTARLAASLYRNRIQDLIAIETDPATALQQHRNVGGAEARGLELEGRALWGGVALRASVAWQNVRHESGAIIANAPRRLAKFLVTLPLAGSVRLGWETHYTGPRLADSGDVAMEGSPVGGHAVSHLTLGGGFGAALDWQLRLANVFDRRYGDVVGTEFSAAFPGVMVEPMPTMTQDGRRLSGRLRWKF